MKRIRKKSSGILGGVVLVVAAMGMYGLTAPHEPQTPPASSVDIGFIGDSITHGTGSGRTAVQVELAALGSGYTGTNCGVSGSVTADWLPGKPAYQKAVEAFRRHDTDVASIMLGTNDANKLHHVTPRRYQENLRQIINGLRQEGIKKVILNYPPYVVPKAGGRWDEASVRRLHAYAKEIDSLVDGSFVVQGDTKALSYFAQHRDELADGVHPTETGYYRLGLLWAGAFADATASPHAPSPAVADTRRD